MVCGCNKTLKLSVTCNYCNDKGHMNDNCIHLNNKTAYDLQKKEHAMAVKSKKRQYYRGLMCQKVETPQTLIQARGD